MISSKKALGSVTVFLYSIKKEHCPRNVLSGLYRIIAAQHGIMVIQQILKRHTVDIVGYHFLKSLLETERSTHIAHLTQIFLVLKT